MIRLKGPVRELLDDTPSDERVARIEQAVARRRAARSSPSWPLVFAGAGAVAAALAAVLWLAADRREAPVPSAPIVAERAAPVIAPEPEPPSPKIEGALVEAEPESAIELVRTGDTLRFLLAEGGRVTLDIPPGTGRIWIVDAGLAQVQVLGTRFSVARFADRVEVSVERGRVRVSSDDGVEELVAGQRLDVRPSKKKPARPVVKKSQSEQVDRLLEEADSARASGDHQRALVSLSRITGEHATDPRAGLAAFMIARIEQDTLSRPRAAAEALDEALRLGLPEELREAARARRFEALALAEEHEAARRAALEYLVFHPAGRAAAAARRLSGIAP